MKIHDDELTPERLAKFWSKIVPTSRIADCWVWAGTRMHGYGYFRVNNKFRRVHRLAYQHYVGKISAGLTIDHLCRNRACVNVSHLEAVTVRENVLRGVGLTAKNAAKTHCPKGHPLCGRNLVREKRGRACRECKLEWARRRYRETRDAAGSLG